MGKTVNERNYVAEGRKYAEQVLSGEVAACKWVRLACERQLRDVERAAKGDWQWEFNEQRANHPCQLIELLPHVKGRWDTRNIELQPHQCFRLTTIFGWIDRETKFRRFRKALVILPRKNGKTVEAACIGLYLLVLDKEPGAEVYSAATTRDQAKISWSIAKQMLLKSPGFCDKYHIEPAAHSIFIESEGACFKPLSRDADSLEGLNPHGAIVDELHAHKTREVFDVLDEATGSRKQPLLYVISTEGDASTGIFPEQDAYGQQVVLGNHEDDSYFYIRYGIDPEDDWTARESWRKANPNLGVSVFEDDIEIRCRQAQKNPESQASFLCKRLNVRVGAGNAYFNMLAWERKCCDPSLKSEDFYGQPCYIAVDLASKIDVAAKIRLFERNGLVYIFGTYYLPEEQLERGKPNYDFYRGWADRGYITLTPGNMIDHDFIERDVLEDARNFDLLHLGVDPHNATQFNGHMMDAGLPVEEVTQGVLSLSDPMKELGARILDGRVRHNGDPVLHWMISNVAAYRDANDNVKARKARDENKIDGAVAAIMGMKLLLAGQEIKTISYSGLRVVG